MKKPKNRITAIAIAIFLMLSMTASTMLVPSASAHTPPRNFPTYAFCSVAPNPVGVGQTVYVNFFLSQPPPTALEAFGDRWHGMTLNVTKPDGITTTLGSFTSDASGGTSTTFIPTQVGNYTFQMSFPGQTLAGNNPPPPNWLMGNESNVYIGDYFGPSVSNVATLNVQQEPLTYLPLTPLPTSYWSRPIYGENNNWNVISGNWLGLGKYFDANTGWYNASGNYNPYTTAPTSAHILWTKPEAFGGIIGGEFGDSQTSNYYSTAQYEPKFAPIIMQGILYYEMYPGSSTYPAGWAAVNLRTGETLWTQNNTQVLRCGQILNYIVPNQFGGLAYLWATGAVQRASFASTGSVFSMYDAMTGNYILSIVNGTDMTLTEDAHGNLIGYYVNATNPYEPTLNMWNSTRCINLAVPGLGIATTSAGGPPEASNWIWRPPQDGVIDFGLGIQWTAPIATNISGIPLYVPQENLLGLGGEMLGGNPFVEGDVSGDVVLLTEDASSFMGQLFFQTGWRVVAGYSALDGHQLFITNRTETPMAIINPPWENWLTNGVQIECSQSEMTVTGYSAYTGEKIWGPVSLPDHNPFDALGATPVFANDTMYLWFYGGDIYAVNVLNGNIKWHYITPSGGLDCPYSNEPLFTMGSGSVAGGLLFVGEGHEYSPPLFHGAQQLAINITNGQLVWSIDAFDVTSVPAVSDGVMTTLNAYDNQIYAYGKGPSAITVTAPSVGVTTSTPITISGTVTDISAGTKQEAQAANFPYGVPAVSDDSQTGWMEYVYMQQPCPSNVTGVPVTLSVLDSNGNYRQIGTTTSDGSGTFAYTWKPDIPGDFTVVANFAGSESYYPSNAEAHFTASAPAPTASPYPTVNLPPTEMYFTISTVAIIIAIAIVGLLLMRKKP